jgi:hypothetical protein
MLIIAHRTYAIYMIVNIGHFMATSGNSTCIISSISVNARCVLHIRQYATHSSALGVTYFNRELLIVPSNFLAAICAFCLPTTLLANSGTNVFNTVAASFLLLPLS